MKTKPGLLLAVVSGLCASASWAADPAIDFVAAAVAGGIDGYAITATSATKLKGSPFVPTGLPAGHSGPQSVTPKYLIMSPTRDVVFAVYFSAPTSGAHDSVVQLKFSKGGFVQQSLAVLASGGGSNSGGDTSRDFGATTNYFFFNDSSAESPSQGNWHLYYTKGGLTPIGEIDASFAFASAAYFLEENENAVYACYGEPGGPYSKLDVYTLSATSLAFAFSSTDPELITAKCSTASN